MTLVKCQNCGAERDLSYDQIKTVHLEKRTCPTCGIGTEAVVIKETRFQPLASYIVANEPAVAVPADVSESSGSESQESETEKNRGIKVGPGGGISRRPKPRN